MVWDMILTEDWHYDCDLANFLRISLHTKLLPVHHQCFHQGVFECPKTMDIYIYTLWLFNIAMENGPFIDDLPIKNGDFPWLC